MTRGSSDCAADCSVMALQITDDLETLSNGNHLGEA